MYFVARVISGHGTLDIYRRQGGGEVTLSQRVKNTPFHVYVNPKNVVSNMKNCADIRQGGPEETTVAAPLPSSTGVRGVGEDGVGRVASARRS